MAVNVSEAVDGAPLGRFHVKLFLLCSLMVTLDGFDLSGFSFVVGDLTKALGIERAAMGPVLSAGLFGLTLGAFTFGLVGDRIGPKRTFVLCGVIFGAFTLAITTVSSLTGLMVCRALAGWGLGGATPLSVAIISDFFPKRMRTAVVIVMYTSLTLGGLAGGFVYADFTLFGWRSIFVVGGVLPILAAPLFLAFLPERLEHLVMHGAASERIAALLRAVDPRRDLAGAATFVMDRANKASFQPAQLFQDGRGVVTAVLWVVFFASLLSVYFFNSWLPGLLRGDGLSPTQVA